MILGIGNDMVDIRRIERILDRFNGRFTSRIFTPLEQQKSECGSARATSYAKRFAAKEACSKALGTGFRHGVHWRDLGVVNAPSGRPVMVVTGTAKAYLDRMIPAGHSSVIHLSLTDDHPYAQAMVVICAATKVI
ncbi:MAG: holo-ACP synthase [Hyphomicrobiales bacterium]